jgi:hypothetical protein
MERQPRCPPKPIRDVQARSPNLTRRVSNKTFWNATAQPSFRYFFARSSQLVYSKFMNLPSISTGAGAKFDSKSNRWTQIPSFRSGFLPPGFVMQLSDLRTHFLTRGICRTLGSCYLRGNLRRIARGGVYPLRAVRVIFRSGRRSGTRTSWGVVQSVGHLTVNEDGEGSNPSAPAKIFPSKTDGIGNR